MSPRRLSMGIVLIITSLVATVRAKDQMSLGRPHDFWIKQEAIVQNRGQVARDLRLELPVIPERNLPVYQQVLQRTTDVAPASIQWQGPDLAVLKAASLPARSSSCFTLTYLVRINPVSYRLPWFPRRDWPELPQAVKGFLSPTAGIEADAGEITRFAGANKGGSRDPVFNAKALYAATNRLLTYDASVAPTSALAVLRQKRASCEGYSRLYAALCRAVGIPARLVYGLRLQDEDYGAQELAADGLRHVWNEVYLAGIGWVPVDTTFTYTVNGKREITYGYFARLRDDDPHIILGYGDQKIIWAYHVPPGHPGFQVEHRLVLTAVPAEAAG